MSITPAFLVRLMNHASLSRAVKLGPEDTAAYEFAQDLRVATLEGRLSAIWTHPANELGGMVKKDKRGRVSVPLPIAIARALGLIRGVADYLFLWAGGCCAMEFKSKTGRLNDGQRDFRAWCELHQIPFFIIRSSAEGMAILRDQGVLTDA